tara:strand:+ start:6683 stop:7777 length:1095 start_codon:yes stop_codon:yes gene_type:complete
MGIHKRGKYWYAQFQIEGKTYLQSTKTTNKNQAQAYERKFRNEVYSREYLGDKDPVSLHKALDAFLKTKQDTKNYQGLVSNVRTVKQYFDDGELFHCVSTAEIERFVQKRRDEGRKNQTIHHSIHVLRGAWKHAKKLGYRVVDIEWPVLRKDQGRLKYLTAEQEQSLLDELHPTKAFGRNGEQGPEVWSDEKQRSRQDNYDLVIALLDTGARYSEVAKIEKSQIDLQDRAIELYRSKTDNHSILYMTDRLYNVFKRRFAEDNQSKYVFTNKKGGPRNHATIAIRKAMKRAGLEDFRVHDLRHSLASKLVQNGMSLLEVSKILGHSNISMTMRYAHLESQETAQKARDVLNQVNKGLKPSLAIVR